MKTRTPASNHRRTNISFWEYQAAALMTMEGRTELAQVLWQMSWCEWHAFDSRIASWFSSRQLKMTWLVAPILSQNWWSGAFRKVYSFQHVINTWTRKEMSVCLSGWIVGRRSTGVWQWLKRDGFICRRRFVGWTASKEMSNLWCDKDESHRGCQESNRDIHCLDVIGQRGEIVREQVDGKNHKGWNSDHY